MGVKPQDKNHKQSAAKRVHQKTKQTHRPLHRRKFEACIHKAEIKLLARFLKTLSAMEDTISIDDLATRIENLRITLQEVLTHDVEWILYCADQQTLSLTTTHLQIKKGMVEDTSILYQEVVKVIYKQEIQQDLLELMPYIDDYLEYYASL
jgi:hypothetical protein